MQAAPEVSGAACVISISEPNIPYRMNNISR